MLSTGDVRDWNAAVDQVPRCLILKTPVNCDKLLDMPTSSAASSALVVAKRREGASYYCSAAQRGSYLYCVNFDD